MLLYVFVSGLLLSLMDSSALARKAGKKQKEKKRLPEVPYSWNATSFVKDPCTKCTTYLGPDASGATKRFFTLDHSACQPDPISWACCRSPLCGMQSPCSISQVSQENLKCDKVRAATYIAESTASFIKIQVSDQSFNPSEEAKAIRCPTPESCCGGATLEFSEKQGVFEMLAILSTDAATGAESCQLAFDAPVTVGPPIDSKPFPFRR